MKVTLNVDGKPLESFIYNGVNYIVCPDKGEFEIQVALTDDIPGITYRHPITRKEVVISVDGKSVMTGKPASSSDSGYVATHSLTLPGWRLNDKEVAKFTFTDAATSYAGLTGEGTPGVVGVLVFDEKPVRKHTDVLYAVDLEHSIDLSLCRTRGGSVGAGFGKASDFKTTEVAFIRDDNKPPEKYVAYYRTEKWLRENNIPIPVKPQMMDNPFPGDSGCTPPPGWIK